MIDHITCNLLPDETMSVDWVLPIICIIYYECITHYNVWWHSVTYYDSYYTLWCIITQCDILWQLLRIMMLMTQCDIIWQLLHNMTIIMTVITQCDILWQLYTLWCIMTNVTFYDSYTQYCVWWHNVTYYDSYYKVWHLVYDAAWHFMRVWYKYQYMYMYSQYMYM